MIVVPAIDIRAGKCVRLKRGDFARETVFDDDPAVPAARWVAEGAEALHVVDLAGARVGHSDNRRAVESVIAEARRKPGVVVELGGGIRDLAAVEHWLAVGVDRVIIGTAAVRRPEVVEQAAAAYPGRVWGGIDARDGIVATDGWTRQARMTAGELAPQVGDRGAAGIVYTDIERDGLQTGVNVSATAEFARVAGVPVYASGGVASADDITALRDSRSSGIVGVIVGRALYDGSTKLKDLLAVAAG